MVTWYLSVIDIWHYKDAMLEDGFAEVDCDHHLVTKWAELSVGGLEARFE